MPDLSIEIMQQCKKIGDAPKFFDIGGYHQSFAVGEVVCSCKGFKYHKKCKHVKQIADDNYGIDCDYHQMFDGPPKVDGVCPKCGGETEYVKVGV